MPARSWAPTEGRPYGCRVVARRGGPPCPPGRGRPYGCELEMSMSGVVMTRVADEDLGGGWHDLLEGIYGGSRPWADGRVVLVKPNAVNWEPHVYVDPDALGALVAYLRETGARRVVVAESCTNGSFTRLVFEATGIRRSVMAAGGRVVYLDEGPQEEVRLGPRKVRFPRFAAHALLRRRNEHFYVDLAKLKTHCMTTVTLCIKNQWALVAPADRGALHDESLHRWIRDLYTIVQPDLCLVEGLVATNRGHFPLKGFEDRCLWRPGVLIGGRDAVEVDSAACRLVGIDPRRVKHILLAAGDREALLDPEVRRLVPIEGPAEPFSSEPIDWLPEGARFHAGSERCCVEGCYSNPLVAIQVLATGYGGRGSFDLFAGRGHDPETVRSCKGPALVVGPCAYGEVHGALVERLGRSKVRYSPSHNSLRHTLGHLLSLMGVSVLRSAPVPPHRLAWLTLRHLLAGGRAELGFF